MKDYIHNKAYARMFIESSFIHNIHNMETIQVSNNRKLHKQTVLNLLTLVNKKEQTTGWILKMYAEWKLDSRIFN